MKNNLLSDYEILTRKLKDKPAASPETRIPKWLLECDCRSCKGFRKMIAGKSKKERMREITIS